MTELMDHYAVNHQASSTSKQLVARTTHTCLSNVGKVRIELQRSHLLSHQHVIHLLVTCTTQATDVVVFGERLDLYNVLVADGIGNSQSGRIACVYW